MIAIKRPHPIQKPLDLSRDSGYLLYCLLVNFGTCHTRKILSRKEPYASEVLAKMDSYENLFGVIFEQYAERLTSNYRWILPEPNVWTSNDKDWSAFLQKVSKALFGTLKLHQVAYCKYMVEDLSCLILVAGAEPYRSEIRNDLNNIFSQLR